MLASELRRKYIEFFVGKGAKLLPSDSLVPQDSTLLFTSAGMVQFKPYFLGEQTPPASRAVSVQKCLRTTDIEDVGDTSHCTFFEMLGNFSFGDYFKPDAIAWAWEFLTSVLQLPLDRLRFSVYEDDNEARENWVKCGVPERKIFRFDEHDNYWPAGAISLGPNGPCGPCSEIFWDTQPDLPQTPDGVWDDKRWLEIWNLVFIQFDRQDGGTLNPLPMRSIDTGMGLERTSAALANLRGPFETDLFAPILRKLEELSGVKYTSSDDNKTDIAFRRIADHVRATAFCIADGVLPSNVGRGYVLRRIMRRAILAGRNSLGLEKPFLTDVLPTVIDARAADYPALEMSRETILRYARIEESQFRRTLEAGSTRLNSLLDSSDSVSARDAFDLFTTHGFPVEMTVELAAERGQKVDLDGFRQLLNEHAKISEGGKTREVYVESIVPELRQKDVRQTLFVGYSEPKTSAEIVAIVNNGKLTDGATEGETIQIVLDQTPFYAEAGGQISDTGTLHGDGGALEVSDTQKNSGYFFHSGTVTAGELRVGDRLDARIDAGRRASIERNHTTTHLLHRALQVILGPHVQQRGSLVAPNRLRFDFAHDKALTPDEIRQVEGLVNEKILDDIEVQTFEKPIAEAQNMGAMMLFGEKYGDVVRVVQAGDYSLEFCGGTHLRHTSQAGLFKIVSESSSQAGVRRLEAVTGKMALVKTLDQERLLGEIAQTLKTTPTKALEAVEKIQGRLLESEQSTSQLEKQIAHEKAKEIAGQVNEEQGLRYVSHRNQGFNVDTLRFLVDGALEALGSGVAVVGGVSQNKAWLFIKASKDYVQRGLHTGNIVKEASKLMSGNGGGRPDFGQASGTDIGKLEEAMESARKQIYETIATEE